MRAWVPLAALFVLAVPLLAEGRDAAIPSVCPVTDYGAKADGIADDTAAFQSALDKAGKDGGGIAWVPAGTYLLKGTLTVPSGVTLEGVLKAPPALLTGSILRTTEGKGEEDGKPFITLKANATLKGVCIYYPEQSKEHPIPYPWCVHGEDYNNAIIDVLMMNPWQAVDFGSVNCGRHLIRGLNAQPLRRGIYVDRCYDIGRMENVHLWPFWTVNELDCPASKLAKEQGEGFILGRSDWEYISNSFAIMYKIGIHVIRSKAPSIGGGNYLFTQSGADVSENALVVEETQDHAGISFSNCQLFGDVVVKPTNNGNVRFTGCGFFGSLDGKHGTALANLAGHGRIAFENCSFHCIEPRNLGTTMIVANAGRLSIENCQFLTSDFTIVNPASISLAPGVVAAIITGNEFYGKMRIVNRSQGRVIIANNLDDTEKAYMAKFEGRGLAPIPVMLAGTERTTLVPNGDFGKGASFWKVSGDIFAGHPVAKLPAGLRAKSVLLATPGKHNYPNAVMEQSVKLKPNTEYILSAYVWNFPRPNETLMANVDVGVNTPGYLRLTVGPAQVGASAGYFLYGKFNTSKTGSTTIVRAFFDGSSKFLGAKYVGAQWANVAITEAAKFKPPKTR